MLSPLLPLPRAWLTRIVSCHTLRHSFATHLLAEGYDIHEQQDDRHDLVNLRLERTRAVRSPLSRKPFGAKIRAKARWLLVMLALPSFGCVEKMTLRYDCASVEPYRWGEYRVVKGDRQVLQLYRVRGVPVPDSFSGYSLYLSLDSRLVSNGRELLIPGNGVQAYLWTLSAPLYKRTEAVTGRILIKRVRRDSLAAFVDVEAKDLNWRHRGEITFTSAVIVSGAGA